MSRWGVRLYRLGKIGKRKMKKNGEKWRKREKKRNSVRHNNCSLILGRKKSHKLPILTCAFSKGVFKSPL